MKFLIYEKNITAAHRNSTALTVHFDIHPWFWVKICIYTGFYPLNQYHKKHSRYSFMSEFNTDKPSASMGILMLKWLSFTYFIMNYNEAFCIVIISTALSHIIEPNYNLKA